MPEVEVDFLFGSDHDRRVEELMTACQDIGFSSKSSENLAIGIAVVDFEANALPLTTRKEHQRTLLVDAIVDPKSEMRVIATFQEAIRKEFKAIQGATSNYDKLLILEFKPETEYFFAQFSVKPTKEQLEPIDRLIRESDLSIDAEFPASFDGCEEPGVCLALSSNAEGDGVFCISPEKVHSRNWTSSELL